ncbi:unnamed protein product [Ectocarpus sp. CCAP 1310/34]|nr:unnamed protein product [Ectocarpus sp. CCAP 1310/34]
MQAGKFAHRAGRTSTEVIESGMIDKRYRSSYRNANQIVEEG